MKIKRNVHKAWSTWGIGLVGVLLAADQVLPGLEALVSPEVFDWITLGVTGATFAARFIDQKLDGGVFPEDGNGED